jgi:L-ribulose-5-phosphate 4-epimerase
VIVDLEGTLVEGDLRPSSDTATHLELYRSFPSLGGVAHTHSTYATAWAQARRPLPCFGTTHADNFRGEVPVTAELTPEALAGDYELATGKVIVQAFAGDGRDARPTGPDPLQVPAVLVACHGPFTWGPTPAAAVENSLVLEYVAQMAAVAEGLAPGLPGISCGLQDKHFLRKHGDGAYYGQK